MVFRKDDERPENVNGIWLKLYRQTGDKMRSYNIPNYPSEIELICNTNAKYKELYDVAAEQHCEYANRYN